MALSLGQRVMFLRKTSATNFRSMPAMGLRGWTMTRTAASGGAAADSATGRTSAVNRSDKRTTHVKSRMSASKVCGGLREEGRPFRVGHGVGRRYRHGIDQP